MANTGETHAFPALERFGKIVLSRISSWKFWKERSFQPFQSWKGDVFLLSKGWEIIGGHKNKEYKIDSCLNCKDTHIVSGSEDGLAYVWDLIDAKILHKLDHSTNRAIHSLTFHPSDTCLLTASADKYYVWKSRYASSLS